MRELLLIILASTLLLACKKSLTDELIIHKDNEVIYSPQRIQLLKAYAEAHYSNYYEATTGTSTWPGVEIDPKVIVVHYTVTNTLEETMDIFRPDTLRGRVDLSRSGKANVGVQFIIDQDGSIHQIMPDNYFARHCIGLNHCAIGFENVGRGDITEAGLRGQPQSNKELTLAQLKANVALIRHLKQKYPAIEILIGHQEYTQLEDAVHPGNKYFQENDPGYRTQKSDPGDRFLQALREELKDILQPGTNGQVFK